MTKEEQIAVNERLSVINKTLFIELEMLKNKTALVERMASAVEAGVFGEEWEEVLQELEKVKW